VTDHDKSVPESRPCVKYIIPLQVLCFLHLQKTGKGGAAVHPGYRLSVSINSSFFASAKASIDRSDAL
jgi:hypothetical protein